MKLKVDVKKHKKSFLEYERYNTLTKPSANMFIFEMYITFALIIISIIKYLIKSLEMSAMNVFFLGALINVCLLLLIAFRYKKIGLNTKIFLDLDGEYEFIIEDEIITRKSKFNTIKLPFSEISKAVLLRMGIALYNKNNRVSFFIPLASLPVDGEEFISSFKGQASIKKVSYYFEKKLFKVFVSFLIAIILGILLAGL